MLRSILYLLTAISFILSPGTLKQLFALQASDETKGDGILGCTCWTINDPQPPGLWSKTLSKLNLELGGPYQSKEEIIVAIKNYLANHPDLIGGLNPERDLRPPDVHRFPYSNSLYSDTDYVQFVQQIPGENLEVAYTSATFYLRGLKGSNIIITEVNTRLYPNLSTLLSPPKNYKSTTLHKKAREALRLNKQSKPIIEDKCVGYLSEKGWHRIYEVTFVGNDHTVIIDLDTGKILDKRKIPLAYPE